MISLWFGLGCGCTLNLLFFNISEFINFQVLYNSQSGSGGVQQITLNPGPGSQLQGQGNFTLSQNSRQYCVTTGPPLQNHLQQLNSGSTFSITPVSSSSGQTDHSQNIVQVQVSQAPNPNLVHQQTMNSVVNVSGRGGGSQAQSDGSSNNGIWNTYASSPNSPQVVNVNLNGSGGSARIIRCGKGPGARFYSIKPLPSHPSSCPLHHFNNT